MKPVDRRPMNPKCIIIESSQEFFHVDIPPPPSAGLSQSLIDRRPPLLYLHRLYRRGSSWRRSPASIILFFCITAPMIRFWSTHSILFFWSIYFYVYMWLFNFYSFIVHVTRNFNSFMWLEIFTILGCVEIKAVQVLIFIPRFSVFMRIGHGDAHTICLFFSVFILNFLHVLLDEI